MAYKKNTVVISVPVDADVNTMLREIVLFRGGKSKTQMASQMLTKAVRLEYDKLRRSHSWDKNIHT